MAKKSCTRESDGSPLNLERDEGVQEGLLTQAVIKQSNRW